MLHAARHNILPYLLPLQTWPRLVWLSCLDATLATTMITEDNWTGNNRARAFSPPMSASRNSY